MGYVSLRTVFGMGKNVKETDVWYMVINSPSPYNIIVDHPAFNFIEAILSTHYLTMKYSLDNGQVGVTNRNQQHARQCYRDNLKL